MPIEPCYAERHSPPSDPASPLLRVDGRGIQLGCHTVRSHGLKLLRRHVYDWIILSFLMVLVAILNVSRPFYRFVGKEMMADIKYPHQSNTVPSWAVPVISIILPLMVIIPFYYYKKDVYDLHHAILGVLFSVLITGVITDAIKNAVGRPRPDFFWRCFPDGNAVLYDCLFFKLLDCFNPAFQFSIFSSFEKGLCVCTQLYDPVTGNVICHGKEYLINDGHKSFPSGHTSWSFAGLGFLSLYLSAKIRAFDQRGHVAKLCIILLPLFIACLVGISRVDDYRHHWQDVFAGGLLGLMVATFCYRQFFPAPYHNSGWQTYAYQRALTESGNAHIDSAERPSEAATSVGSPRSQHTQITEEELESQRT